MEQKLDIKTVQFKNLQKKVKAQRATIFKLKKQIQKLKNCTKAKSRGNLKNQALSILKECIPEQSVFNFLATQIKLSGKNKYHFRYTIQEKSLFLSLFSASPKCYRLLKKIIHLPSVSTLQKMLQKLQFHPGFHQFTLNSLEAKCKHMSQADKQCVILMDEMSLKEAVHYNSSKDEVIGYEDYGLNKGPGLANHATVFMVRGLTNKWKQPFAYFFSSGAIKATKLKTLLIEAIRAINKTGLICCAIVCDQGSNNQSVMKSLGINVNKPFFTVDDNKINLIYDPPHALKNVRNNLKSTGFKLDNIPVTWSIIEQLYSNDIKRNVRMVPKLNDKHINLQGFGLNMRVKLASQILSHSVSSAIKTLCELNFWSNDNLQSALKTSEFVKTFNDLFDIFNSKTFNNSKPFNKPLSNNTQIWNFLENTLSWLKNLKSLNKPITYQLPCIEAWQININSIKDLWNRLSSNPNINLKFIMTNRLNQDALENFFSQIRAKNRNDDRPDSCRFQTAFRSISFESIFNQSTNSNCEIDNDSFLLKPDDYYNHSFRSLDSLLHEHNYSSTSSETVASQISETEPDIFELNSLSYVAGYLLKKFHHKNSCQACKTIQINSQNKQQLGNKYIFIKNKQYSSIEHGLIVPSERFLSLAEPLNNIISSNLNSLCPQNTANKITKLCIKEISNHQPVTCGSTPCHESLLAIIKLFIKVKINFSIKLLNQSIKKNKSSNKKLRKITHQ